MTASDDKDLPAGAPAAVNQADLAARVGSRICHDLVSPLGAIGNGVELLALSGHGETPEMALITESVRSANARLRFFRIAFGAPAPGQMIAASEIADILRALGHNPRQVLAWQVTGDQPRDQVRAAFLALQCVETALPFGGQIAVTRSGTSWKISARSERMRRDPALWSRLEQPATDLPPAAQIHFAMLPAAVLALNSALRLELADNLIVIQFD